MRSLILFFALLGMVFSSSSALAVGEYSSYFGFDYMLTDFEDDAGTSVDLDAVSARFGSYLNKNVALEARLGFGVSDDTVNNVDFELDNFVGVYARGIIPYQTVELYGIIGMTRADLSVRPAASPAARLADGDETDLSYGLGLDFKIGERIAVGMEYMMLIDSSDYELTTTNIGAKYYF